jgi:hypothetical protein
VWNTRSEKEDHVRLVCVALALAATLCLADWTATAQRPDGATVLEARLATLEAKEEIRELFSRYGFTADTGDAKGWSEIWAENGVYERGGTTMKGRAAFFKSIEDPDGAHKRQIEGKGSVHTTGPLMIHVAGTKAWAEGPALVWVRSDRGYEPYALSYNHWDLEKNAGRWEIVRRIGRPVAPGVATDVLKAWREPKRVP